MDSNDEAQRTGEILFRLAALVCHQQEALEWHQNELQQTNAGLLALHTELEQQRRQLAFLDEITSRTARSLEAEQVTNSLVRLLKQHGFADEGVVWVSDEEGTLGPSPADDDLQPGAEVRKVFESNAMCHAEDRYRVLLPLRVGSQRLGVLELSRMDCQFKPDEDELTQHIASRVAVALRNAAEYERERELAATLQRAMLPQLPSLRGVEVCAQYRPATRGVNIGGDWYDAFTRPDGSMVLAVGDVTGHGLDAAVLMGRLQNSLRAYALEGHGPSRTLHLMHRLLDQQRSDLFATAVVAEMNPGSGELRWASAGHLPPLLRAPSGQVESLERRHSPMLGLPVEVPIPEYSITLPPGAALLLYTDGLVERRGAELDAGLRQLASAFHTAPREDAHETARRLLTAMLGRERHDDDVCLLLCRRLSTPERARY